MPKDEIVDILDDNNKILYQTTKKEAHTKGLLHACVVSEIKDSQGRWVLVKQASNRQDANQYVSPIGGHVSAGESYDDALKREALEEAGLENFKFNFIGKLIFNRFVKHLDRQENHLFVVYEIYTDLDLSLNHEAVEFARFTDEELREQLKTTPEKFGDAFHFLVDNLYPKLK